METLKFLLQTLIIPGVLTFFGYEINNTLQEKQQVFDKVKFTDQVLNEAFDARNADKALALATLIPQLVNDTAFANKLMELICIHSKAEATKALQSGNDTAYARISNAAKTYQNTRLSALLKTDPITSKAENAIVFVNRGLEQYRQGKLREAEESYKKADEIYLPFHSAEKFHELTGKNEARMVKAK